MVIKYRRIIKVNVINNPGLIFSASPQKANLNKFRKSALSYGYVRLVDAYKDICKIIKKQFYNNSILDLAKLNNSKKLWTSLYYFCVKALI